ALALNARTWDGNVSFETRRININGAQNMGGHDLTILYQDGLLIGDQLVGTGNLNIGLRAGSSFAIGSSYLSLGELAMIADGWDLITFGREGYAATMNIAAFTFNDNVKFINGAGGVTTVSGDLGFGAN